MGTKPNWRLVLFRSYIVGSSAAFNILWSVEGTHLRMLGAIWLFDAAEGCGGCRSALSEWQVRGVGGVF